MAILEFPDDRIVDSTDTNEYAEGLRDENLIEEDLIDTEVATEDRIPGAVNETAEGNRPLYDEEGYRHPQSDF